VEKHLIKSIDPLADPRWDDFIYKHPEGQIFHHSMWTRVLRERYGNVYRYYILENDIGEIRGAIPFFNLRGPVFGNQFICLPCADSCVPLGYSRRDCDDLLNGVIREVSQNKRFSIQIRGWNELGVPTQGIIPRRNYYELTQVVDLQQDLATLKQHMTRNGRYNLRVAERQSFTVKLAQEEKDLKVFYKMLLDTLKKRDVLPPSYSFFQSIFKHIIMPGYGSILFSELNGKIVAANLYLNFKETALCKYSAQIDNCSEHRSNYFLHWKAIELFHNKSIRFYDFGGTDPNLEGLLFFKRNWGGKETRLSFYIYPNETDMRLGLVIKPMHFAYKALENVLPSFARETLSKVMNKFSVE
jgi:hypothetical protein